MARNRIIHNVQDVFVGSSASETSHLITGISGHQILKRLNKVQNFNYSIDIPKDDKFTLGQSKPFSRSSNTPPTVNLSMSYLLDGVDNEDRIGLNTNNENESETNKDKTLFHDMFVSSQGSVGGFLGMLAGALVGDDAYDKRNIYLTISEEDDVRKHNDPSNILDDLYSGTFTENDIIDPGSPDYNVVVFQNCYLTQYNMSVSATELPTVSLNYVADNVEAYVSGSGIGIPVLDLKSGTVERAQYLIYSSKFGPLSTDVDGWIPTNDTVSWVSDFGGQFDSLVFYPTGGNEGHYITQNLNLTAGRTYKLQGKVYIDSGPNQAQAGVRIYNGQAEDFNTQIYSCIDCWGQGWVDFTIDSFEAKDSYVTIYGIGLGGAEGNDWIFDPEDGEDKFGIKDLVVTCLSSECKEFIIPKHFDYEALALDIGRELVPGGGVNITITPEPLTTAVYTSNFSDAGSSTSNGFDGWVAPPAQATLNRTNCPTDCALVIECNDTPSTTHYAYSPSMLTVGKKYKLTGKGYIGPNSTHVDHIRFYDGVDYSLGDFVGEARGTWQDFSVEFTHQGSLHYISAYMQQDGAAGGGTNFDCEEGTDFIVLKDIVVAEIETHQVKGAECFFNDTITSCEISCALNRDAISYVGYKLFSQRPANLPIQAELSFNAIVKENISGSFLDNMDENKNYNIEADFRYAPATATDDGLSAKYTFSGAKLNGINYDSSIGANTSVSMNFSTITDFENKGAGVYISGKVLTLGGAGELVTNDGDDLYDNNGNRIVLSAVYLQY
ncbi:hypothetical protein CL634_08620 [bacterium]|nr:hypothetical protein [bacterium]